MKKTINLLFVLLFAVAMSSCNAFDFVDPDLNSLDRCKSYNDAGDYDSAIAACTDADPDGTNEEAQLELADASFGALGINIQSLSTIFLNQTGGTITLVDLAESILARASVNRDNAVQSKEYAQNAVDAMDRYGALHNDTLEEKRVGVFYSLLARVCQVSLLMAYADIDSPVPDGRVTKADICNPTQVDCAASSVVTCTGTRCEGMDSTDTGTAADSMMELVSLLDTPASEGGLPSNLDVDAVTDMVNITIPYPGTNIPTPITDFATDAFKPDAGRRILLEIARDE